ncbi:MAG: AbrB family transcriptional regulator [Candidatus Parcubacteria bacterium]|nr:MAG: AbrB family transcriptional regulator [Candidatus Parcubacteria bacterium]
MIKKDFKKFEKKFYGSTIIGERGQIVIPKEARDDLKLKKGDKILVFGMKEMITLMKFSEVKKIMSYLEKHLEDLRKILKQK